MHKALLSALLVISLVVAEASDFPKKPAQFNSPQEVKEYVRKVYEHLAIASRLRYGRSINKRSV
uniref:Conotoxin n=1 Tax=Conus praecellens TaxID=128530 RepID=A0A291C2A0_CONPC|nr:conotoxin [Conus praecellens]